jgi:hypothetical protein
VAGCGMLSKNIGNHRAKIKAVCHANWALAPFFIKAWPLRLLRFGKFFKFFKKPLTLTSSMIK